MHEITSHRAVAITHRFLDVRGLRMHVAEAGAGPLVLLLHGFPETGYSFRHQLGALAAAGYHVVAPDLRGYGQTDRPAEVADYTLLHLVGDVIGLLDTLGEQQAVVVGHDWGAMVAWHTALLRPERVRAVIGMSVPYTPRGSGLFLSGGPVAPPPVTALRQAIGDGFYVAYFQQPEVADKELDRAPRTTLRRLFHSASGDGNWQPVVAPGEGFLDTLTEPETLPGWLTAADLDTFTADFAHSGFTGGLNYYRNIDRNWTLLTPWHLCPILAPSLFMLGDRDLAFRGTAAADITTALRKFTPNLRETIVLPGCGHWTQQERPAAVNAALLAFLRSLPSIGSADS